MKRKTDGRCAFTLVEIMTVVVIVGILSALAVPALMRVKRLSEDTIVLNTLRQLYDAKELYFSDEGAGKAWVNVKGLTTAGYVSHALEAATQHDVGGWHTGGLRTLLLKPGEPLRLEEAIHHGRNVTYTGRVLVYPPGK